MINAFVLGAFTFVRAFITAIKSDFCVIHRQLFEMKIKLRNYIFIVVLVIINSLIIWPVLGQERILNTDIHISIVSLKEQYVIDSILRSTLPVRIMQSLDVNIRLAQNIALRDSNFTKFVVDTDFNVINRCEIFSVSKANIGDVKVEGLNTAEDLYKLEMFNFAENITTIGIVDVKSLIVVRVNHFRNFQTEVPDRLKRLAIEIALESSLVSSALGYTPETKDAVMANTKTSLSKTKCERSRHLCVAPTFIKNSKALWVIVDLTDLRVVGIEWTNLGEHDTQEIVFSTERALQNKTIYECYCQKLNHYTDSLWSFDYNITSTDGLKISNATYKNQKIIESAKLVDWKVSYSPTKGFGYSDAVGCPFYSGAVVVAVQPPKFEPILVGEKNVGVCIYQEFQSAGWPGPCNYNYAQKFEFYNDGSFRVAGASLGRGCGTDGTYRPVYRIHLSGDTNNFASFSSSSQWEYWTNERYAKQSETDELFQNRFLYRIDMGKAKGYYVEPCIGQFGDGGRGDNAWIYITKYHDKIDEGSTDLPTISSCCNIDFQQGPEKFINKIPEKISESSLVIWYVPQILNDNRPGKEYCWAEYISLHGVKQTRVYPCWNGPKFVPINIIK